MDECDWEIIEKFPKRKELAFSEALINGNRPYYKNLRAVIYFIDILKEMACIISSCTSADSADAESYNDPNKYCTVKVKIHPKLANRIFAHAELTSCHSAPKKYRSWISVWKAAAIKAERINGARGANISSEVSGCSFTGCEGFGILGAHVWYVGSMKKYSSWYIVPACSACNRQHGLAKRLKPGTILVKVVDGKIFSPNVILIGMINTTLIRKRRRPKTARIYPRALGSGPDDGPSPSDGESDAYTSESETEGSPKMASRGGPYDSKVVELKLPPDVLKWRTPESESKGDPTKFITPADLPVRVVPPPSRICGI